MAGLQDIINALTGVRSQPTDDPVNGYVPPSGWLNGGAPFTQEAPKLPEVPHTEGLEGMLRSIKQHYMTPGEVMRGVQTTTPGMLSDEDVARAQMLEKQGSDFGPHQALNMIGSGTFSAPTGAVGIGGGKPPFPHYAEEYPPAGPPVQAIDKRTGKPYLAKQLTPEATAFRDTRSQIASEMEGSGYRPYFNPNERYYADPSRYPPNTSTLDIIPKKPETVARDMATIDTPDVRQRLQNAYGKGQQLGGAEHWYAMGQLENEYIKQLGPVEGPKAFRDRFATSMAATTGGADPTSNLLMSHYGNYLRANNLPYPQNAYDMPFPIGGRYVSGNMAQHQKIMDAGGFEGLGAQNPKRHNFAQNFMGNRDVATIDEQMTQGMTPGVTMPPSGKYGLYERVLGEEAAKAGVPPANFQDVSWAGFKDTPGKPMISHVNDAIERTHRLTGMPPEEIIRRALLEGKIPLYGTAGAAGTGLAAYYSGQPPQQQ